MKKYFIITAISLMLIPCSFSNSQNTVETHKTDHSQYEHVMNPSLKTNESERILGPWVIHCVKKAYPNRFEAKLHTHGRQIKLEICSAKQTIKQTSYFKTITATYELTPFSIIFFTHNIIVKPHEAKIILGNKKTFSLYSDCHNLNHDKTCSFLLKHPKSRLSLLKEMKNNHHLLLKIADKNSTKPITLVFSLVQIDPILQIIQSSEKKVKQRFKQAFSNKIRVADRY